MIATNHALSGALLGAILPLPIAIPIAFASHFILDTLPHYGIPHNRRNTTRSYKLIVLCDTVVALGTGASCVIFHKWSMLIAGLAAYSPDSIWVAQYFKHGRDLRLHPNGKFADFHMRIQRYERAWGIVIDLLFTAVLLPLFINQLRH